MSQQYDLFESRKARDAGMAQVDAHDPGWAGTALKYIIDTIPHGIEIDNQSIQVAIIAHGCPPPKHHNSWGSLFSKAKKKKVLTHVGYTKAARVASHARVISIYRRI